MGTSLMRGVLTVVALGALLARGSTAQQAKRIEPGMTKAQVFQVFGAPAVVRSVGELTYYFYPNCQRTCGTADMVVFHNKRVINAFLRGPERVYAATDSALNSIKQPDTDNAVRVALEAQSAKPDSVQESRPVWPPEIEPTDNAVGNRGASLLQVDDVAPRPLEPQEGPRAADRVPEEAKRLVVQVIGQFADAGTPEIGAGIIVGATADTVFIATARHVLVREGAGVRDLRVVFRGDTKSLMRAIPTSHTRAGLDLALIKVPIASARGLQSGMPSFDRRGDVRSLRSGAPVSPVGCPQGVCWEAPSSHDVVLGIDRQGILFQTNFIAPGSSGGALFNQWWEVVGLVTEEQPPRGEAISIDRVVDQVRYWGYPTHLTRTAVPRGGYRTFIGVSFLAPANSTKDPVLPKGRVPGGRVTLAHRVLPAVGWHVGALRLTPENVSITAGVAGAGLHLKRGRFAFRPYVELGFGRVEARYAADSVPITGGWLPLWTSVQQDGLGAGGGLSLEVVAIPRTILEIGVGYWRFSVPEEVPRPSGFYLSTGLRAGL